MIHVDQLQDIVNKIGLILGPEYAKHMEFKCNLRILSTGSAGKVHQILAAIVPQNGVQVKHSESGASHWFDIELPGVLVTIFHQDK